MNISIIQVTGSYDSSAAIYDRVAAKKLYNLKDHTDSVTTLQFDTNGTLVKFFTCLSAHPVNHSFLFR